jgi:hypothetical protein
LQAQLETDHRVVSPVRFDVIAACILVASPANSGPCQPKVPFLQVTFAWVDASGLLSARSLRIEIDPPVPDLPGNDLSLR